ncbi:transcription factor GTE10-like isoform X2 [Amaranthus tricolor]|uniref:transcription factor GTE10-like isoform X2 n=1 Tax=Amaranthus tricolor TaxID=29722 RepID=UPI002589B497|nr:transcription factor GTE10-like isoform X2 [Amaranthus tricolor]
MAPAIPIVYTGRKESKNYSRNMMGKSRKFSMANQRSAIISDYRHATEITAESEGFGSSGRVDTEVTLSEDSCSPKRKCMSLNGDTHDQFGIPMQVLSFSKMSRSDKKDLEIRLKRELEEVRNLRRRIASFSNSAVVLSPASDIRSCSDGLKRPPLENTLRPPPLELNPVKGKKQPTGGRNGAQTKKGFPGKIDPRKQIASANASNNSMLMKRCENLLTWLMQHQFGWVFKEPVDVVKLNIPDYFTVIKHPMDLGTVKTKLSRGEYTSPLGFAADVRLTFSNAMTYNPAGNDVHFMAQTLSKNFEQRWKVIEKKMSSSNDVQVLPSTVQAPVSVQAPIPNEPATVANHIPPSKKKKGGYIGKSDLVKRVMTDDEKHKMSSELEDCLSELPESIIEFLKENSSGAGEDGEEEIEIDIDALSDDVLFKLRKLLDDFLLEKKKNEARAEPCEMELHNEYGFSNSSNQADKVNDAVDEDIDIGGNDNPISSFPPVEIEKDTVNKNNRCSSPSSSSSDSDSDSSSSSSESEGAKALPPANKLQSTVDGKQNVDQIQGDVGQEVGKNPKSRSSLSQVEHSSHTKPPSIEMDGYKEGESAPSEKQVSPDKLYRAALLRSRFADTILKAQEKTLEKGETRDPEKLRLEREELERKQREEKARLQAEARAAEVARKKAELEAAAEAKRKRELEREAARLALQKMEKTVDINENSQFMEDLEMLSGAPADNMSSFMGDTSPNDSENGGLGSFRFRGNSNPLEQLGLYRKDDDEEEEEVETPHNPPDAAANDIEEGEID